MLQAWDALSQEAIYAFLSCTLCFRTVDHQISFWVCLNFSCSSRNNKEATRDRQNNSTTSVKSYKVAKWATQDISSILLILPGSDTKICVNLEGQVALPEGPQMQGAVLHLVAYWRVNSLSINQSPNLIQKVFHLNLSFPRWLGKRPLLK